MKKIIKVTFLKASLNLLNFKYLFMVITYPENPGRPGVDLPGKLKMPFSEGINYIPLWLESRLDFTTLPGEGSKVLFSLISQLGKWGFEVIKIDESIEVSPVFQQYYQLTIAQKQQMEAQIKQNLASIANAITDLDLVKHDWRKYKEFMDYYEMLEKGKKLIKAGKREEGLKLKLQGEQSLKSVFIDQVDVHTGETIALKLIASRWPTIIADFMKLEDEDIEQKKIKEKYGVSEAEAVVLATKNRLYIEWRDSLFKKAVEERFRALTEMMEARKKSVIEYKNMVRPLIARYKLMTQTLERSSSIGAMQRVAAYLPGSQAISSDNVRIWAWKPFAPSEKYKSTREISNLIMAWRAGFRKEEREELKRIFKEESKKRTLSPDEKAFLEEGVVEALPMEPSIDNVIRRMIDSIEKEYSVNITVLDLYNARKRLLERFKKGMRGVGGESWVFSPYFIFLEFPISRVMIRLPNGSEVEDFNVENLTASIQSQNIIILRYLEMIAREKALDNYIKQMLGEMGVSGESIEEIMRMEVFKTEEDKKELEEIKERKKEIKEVMREERWLPHQAIIRSLYKFFKYFGIDVEYFTVYGKYEFQKARIEKQYIKTDVKPMFDTVVEWLKKSFQAPT